MKIWFEHYKLDSEYNDSSVKLGIGWYRHHKDHPWFGFTVELYLFFGTVNINFVNNWKEYDKKINARRHKKRFQAL